MSKIEEKYDNKNSIETNKDLYNVYQKAAENGGVQTQNNLAALYNKGEGTEKRPFIGIKKQQNMDVFKHNLILH